MAGLFSTRSPLVRIKYHALATYISQLIAPVLLYQLLPTLPSEIEYMITHNDTIKYYCFDGQNIGYYGLTILTTSKDLSDGYLSTKESQENQGELN